MIFENWQRLYSGENRAKKGAGAKASRERTKVRSRAGKKKPLILFLVIFCYFSISGDQERVKIEEDEKASVAKARKTGCLIVILSGIDQICYHFLVLLLLENLSIKLSSFTFFTIRLTEMLSSIYHILSLSNHFLSTIKFS